MNSQACEQLAKEDGSVHGRIVYSWGECPYCTTYCKFHVQWILDQGWDIIPDHTDGMCAGNKCSHVNIFSSARVIKP